MHPKTLLILIGSDPRVSPRPAEAVRIGAGVGAWEKVRVSLYLQGAAAHCLTEFPEELVGGNLLEQYLPAIPLHGGEIYVERPGPVEKSFRTDLPIRVVSSDELNAILRTSTYSMNFDAALGSGQIPSEDDSLT